MSGSESDSILTFNCMITYFKQTLNKTAGWTEQRQITKHFTMQQVRSSMVKEIVSKTK